MKTIKDYIIKDTRKAMYSCGLTSLLCFLYAFISTKPFANIAFFVFAVIFGILAISLCIILENNDDDDDND